MNTFYIILLLLAIPPLMWLVAMTIQKSKESRSKWNDALYLALGLFFSGLAIVSLVAAVYLFMKNQSENSTWHEPAQLNGQTQRGIR